MNSSANPLSATTLHEDLSSASLSRGPGLSTNSAEASTFKASSVDSSTLSGAITGNDYFTLSLTPNADVTFSLSRITGTLSNQNGDDTAIYHLLSDKTGFTSGDSLFSVTVTGDKGTLNPFDFDLSTVAGLQNLSTAAELRLYVVQGTGLNGFERTGFQTNPITIEGTTAPIPEPGAACLLVTGLAGLCLRRKRPTGR